MQSPIKGTVNLAFHYKDGVIVAVDSLGSDPKSKHIVSDRVKKYNYVGGIFMTMCRNRSAVVDVWNAIESEVKENRKNGKTTTVERAANCALEFLKQENLKHCELLIIGKNEAGAIDIWHLTSHSKRNRIYVNDPSLTLIKSFSLIGNVANLSIASELGIDRVDMSFEEALEMARSIVLDAALEAQGIGGYVIIHAITLTERKMVTCTSVPKLLLTLYDRVRHWDKIFVLSLNHVPNIVVTDFFRSGRVIPRVDTWQVHTLGPVRSGYNLRLVIFAKGVAHWVYKEVERAWGSLGVRSPSSDRVIATFPFLVFPDGSLFYFVRGTEDMLKELCRHS